MMKLGWNGIWNQKFHIDNPTCNFLQPTNVQEAASILRTAFKWHFTGNVWVPSQCHFRQRDEAKQNPSKITCQDGLLTAGWDLSCFQTIANDIFPAFSNPFTNECYSIRLRELIISPLDTCVSGDVLLIWEREMCTHADPSVVTPPYWAKPMKTPGRT